MLYPHYNLLLDPYIRLQFVPVYGLFVLYLLHKLILHGLEIYLGRLEIDFPPAISSDGRITGGSHYEAGIGVGTAAGVVEETSPLLGSAVIRESEFDSGIVKSEHVPDGSIFGELGWAPVVIRVRNATKNAKQLFIMLFSLVAAISLSCWRQDPPHPYSYPRVLLIILLTWTIFGVSIVWCLLEMMLPHGADVTHARIVGSTVCYGAAIAVAVLSWIEMNHRFGERGWDDGHGDGVFGGFDGFSWDDGDEIVRAF
ncbi:hypothetical protein BKA69DRAFT_155439 [Paraphysoderma sedebokerense]|nr:hypothetical protein BKA69DRAFT_155439 [Paraphysoderma sedebokerense]